MVHRPLNGVHPSRSGIFVNLFGGHGPHWRHESSVRKEDFDLRSTASQWGPLSGLISPSA